MNQMKYKLTSIITALALTLGLITSVNASSDFSPQRAGTSYYVAVNGNDLNACTQAAPCKSFNKAMSLMQSGDFLYVTAGKYDQQMVITKSGLTVIGQGAIIDTTGHTGIKVTTTAQNIVVRGFTVTRTWSHAIWVEGKFVTIENNTVYHSVLENGTLSNGVITCGNGQWGSAIKTNQPASDVVIRGNTVYENCGEGIAATMSKNIVIENNSVRDSKNVNIYVDNSSYVRVLNNNSYCTKASGNPTGIALGEESYSGWGSQLHDVTVSGNTVTKCWAGIMAFGSDTGGTLTNVTFSNNFVPSGETKGISLDNTKNKNVSITNNTYYNAPWIRSSTGVTLKDNVIGTQVTKTVTPSGSSTPTRTLTPTSTNTPTPTSTFTQTATALPSATPTGTLPTQTPTVTVTGTLPTQTPTVTVTGTLPTQTSTVTSTGTLPTRTPTATVTGTLQTLTPTIKVTGTSLTQTPTVTVTGTLPTRTPTVVTPTITVIGTLPIKTPTGTVPTQTKVVPLGTAQPTNTQTQTNTITPSSTFTPIASVTTTTTFTATNTITPTATVVPSVTASATANVTKTPKPTKTPIPTKPSRPTKTPKPTEAPPQNVSGVYYDDTDPAFVYSEGWNDVTKKKAHGSSYKVTSQNGASVTFTFTGQSFSILYSGGPDFRKIEVYVDGALVGTINERMDTNKFQQQWDYSGKLSPGSHTLKLVFVTKKNTTDTKGSFDAVIIR